jgi:hypothetical protein
VYVGHRYPNNAFEYVSSCPEWVSRLRAGRFRFVVIMRFPGEPLPAAAAWSEGLTGTRLVLRTPLGVIFRLDSPPDLSSCSL